MAALGTVLGALISQVTKGRSQADAAALEVAQVYKEHPLLSSFPVPRMTLDEATIELKVAVSASPVARGSVTPQARAEILARVAQFVRDLPSSQPALAAEEWRGLRDQWPNLHPQIAGKLGDIVPADGAVAVQGLAVGSAGVVMANVTRMLDAPESKINQVGRTRFLSLVAPSLERAVQIGIQGIVASVLSAQPNLEDRLDVLVTAAELQGVSPDRVTTLKLTLRESDQSWTDVDTPDGKTHPKLVPS